MMDHVLRSMQGYFDSMAMCLDGDPEKDRYMIESMKVLVKAMRVIEKHEYGEYHSSLKPAEWWGTPYYKD
ncbi:hypothetical protein SY88_09680 [Clostridiales bacterium PH28_bin88]|nr:hypothetical protein SY88_09680 [Clostridiales bacterium PH28_bin88]